MGTGEGGRRAVTKFVHILAFLTIASLLPTSPALPYLLRSSFRRCVRRSLSTVCTVLRERIGGFVSPVVGIHPLSAGIYTGSFMAIVSNIRYNLLQHVLEPFIEVRNGLPTARYSSAHLLARHLTPCPPAEETNRLVDENGNIYPPCVQWVPRELPCHHRDAISGSTAVQIN